MSTDVNITDNDGKTHLFYAVQQSNEGVFCTLVNAGADVNITDNDGQTALFFAVQQSNNEIVVRALIDTGADVNITDNDDQTALFYAVQQSNNESVVHALIDADADVNINDNYGSTALFYAVQQSNNESVVRTLIDTGADVNITDNDDQTALFYAVQQSNNESVVHALIDADADVNITYNDDQTALFFAVQQSNNESVVRALIDADADVNKTNNYGRTALFYAVQQSNNKSVVRALIDAGADVSKTNNYGRTALFYAVKQSNNKSVVRALIDADADVNKTNNYGRTALFYAVQQSNNKSVVRALIDAGADVSKTNNYGRTALFYAVKQSNNKSVVRALIDAGADVNITDNDEQTILFYAVKKRKNKRVQALIDAGADVNITDEFSQTPLFYAVQQSNNESVVRMLIDAGADVNETDDDGQTALLYAVQQSNNESVVRALIDAGADVNKTDNDGQTVLYYAVQESDESVVHLLIDAGADVKIIDNNGETVLFYAFDKSNNKSTVFRALIDAGADVDITDNDGHTFLFYAVQQSNIESVVRTLIDAGADFNITDDNGQTVLFYAVQQSTGNNESVVRALIDAGADFNITDNNGQTALFYAVQQSNNESVVCALISQGGAHLNVKDRYGRMALYYALKNPKSARIILDKGGKQLLYLKDNSNCSILTFFVERYLLLNIPVYLNFLKESEVQNIVLAQTILSIALCKFPLMLQIPQMSRQPISHRIDTTYITKALQLASQYIDEKHSQKKMEMLIAISGGEGKNREGLSKGLSLLVELGADVNSVDSNGNTALHYVTRLPWSGVPEETMLEICHQLVMFGAQFNLRNHENETPLLFCLTGDLKELKEGNVVSTAKTLVEVCTFLSKHGSSIEYRSRSGESVFHLILNLFRQDLQLNDVTVRQDVLQEVIKLMKLFSPAKVARVKIINIPDGDLNSPLHLWASLGLPSPQDYSYNVTKDHTFESVLQIVLKYLIECGVQLNAINTNDETPLHLCKTWSAVKLLIDDGANPNVVDSSRRSPLISAAKRKPHLKHLNTFYPDVSESEEPKIFWKTAIDKGLDPWTSDKGGESVLSILIEDDSFILAKALVDVACEQNYTQSEASAVGLLNAVCKDKSTRTNWKTILVQDILDSRKGPTTASEPLRLCCTNMIETGVSNNESLPTMLDSDDDRDSDDELSEDDGSCDDELSEDDGSCDDEPSPNKKMKMDESVIHAHVEKKEVTKLKESSVHGKIIEMLRLYGTDGRSCLDMAETCLELKDLLTKPLDIRTVSVLIPWTSVSKKYEDMLAKVARRQECDIIHDRFWFHKDHIGRGSFGSVFAGINDKDGREVAIKRIEKDRMQRAEDKREITTMVALAGCEQIVFYVDYVDNTNFAYIVLELMEGNLDEYFTHGSTFDASKSTQLCEDVVKGLKYLHEQNIIHRDLKPGNILYKTHPKLCLKIADFGLSRRIDTNTTTTVYGTNAGTRCWIAPEVLMCTHDHSKESDMFSCGLVVHYVLSQQKHPFSKNNSQIAHEIEANMTKGTMEGWDDSLSPEATHLVQAMLGNDEKNRPTAGQALDYPLFWSNMKKVDFLIAVGNQSVFAYPRTGRSTLTAIETDLEKNFSTIVVNGKWNDLRYREMPAIYTEMTSSKRKSYDTHSVVELVRFIRNAHGHVSESTRPAPIRKLLLEDFVFLKCFPNLVMEVYKVVITYGWDRTVDEVKYSMNK